MIYLVPYKWHNTELKRARCSLEPRLRFCWTVIIEGKQHKGIKGASGDAVQMIKHGIQTGKGMRSLIVRGT